MCSSGLEALSCPISTKFFRSTDLRLTTSPAIATYTLLSLRCSFRPLVYQSFWSCVGTDTLFVKLWF
jgi:hypothetical protein